MSGRTRDEVIEIVENLGYVFIDEYMYKNYRRVIIQDDMGYKYDVDFYTFRKGYIPKYVDTNNAFSLHNISLWLKINKKDFYLTEENEYKNNSTKLNLFCNKCENNFVMDWAHINRNHNCSICRLSKGEMRIFLWLEENKIYHIRQYSFKECMGNKKTKLPFDFYLPDYNMCIEFHGEQHYKEVGYFGGKEKLARTKRTDALRETYCKNNNINLLIIPYWDINKLEKILNERIEH